MMRNRNIVGRNAFFVPLSKIESIDIDTPEDFYIAETLYNQAGKNSSLHNEIR